ncbi:reverse transcriptase [Fasciolopsis buskii]|uniref:Reverse transcriptase n=1 Tax=Fasciolopsis buskii TaxID=27845 RepID=A0A8E0S9S7_9TREM|nr:reverse transcriptase [Fasciolopsis buski]
MSRIGGKRSPQRPAQEQQNPAAQLVSVGSFSGRSGPDLVWRIHDALMLENKQSCSVFCVEKRTLDKTSKSRRKDLIYEVLRIEISNLKTIKNNRFLQLLHGPQENNDYIAFITEPVTMSLADRLDHKNELGFTELEIIFGVYQLTDALRFLHSTQEMMHGNINPGSILITSQGLWKLGGLNFMERIVDTTKTSPKFKGCLTKLPTAAQPNLDFVAPEAQLYCAMSPLADMFSVGMVLCAIHNDGHSLIESDQNPTTYARKLSEIPTKFEKISDRLPKALVEPVRKMISQDIRDRPTSQLFALLKVFNEPTVLSYESLITLEDRSLNQKKEFFNRFSKVIPDFEAFVRYERILPMLLRWYSESSELKPFVLPPLLTMVHVAEKSEYEQYLSHHLNTILSTAKTLQTSIVLMDLIEFFISRLDKSDIEKYVIPELLVCLEPTTNKTVETVQNAINVLSNYLTEDQVRRLILPRLRDAFHRTTSSPKLKLCALECLENLLGCFSSNAVIEDIIPFLSTIRTTDPLLLSCVLAIDKFLLSSKKSGINSSVIAEKLLPPLLEVLTAPSLNLNDFRSLMDALRLMLDFIDRQRTYELILEERKSQSASYTNISASASHIRNLPLIAMQKPTMDGEFMNGELETNKFSRASLTEMQYRRSSGGEFSNPRQWNRTNLSLQRLRASGNRSESVLYNMRHRGSGSSTDRINWNEASSNPFTLYRTHSNFSSRMGGGSPLFIPSPLVGAVPIGRRHSGNLPARGVASQVGQLRPRHASNFLITIFSDETKM